MGTLAKGVSVNYEIHTIGVVGIILDRIIVFIYNMSAKITKRQHGASGYQRSLRF